MVLLEGAELEWRRASHPWTPSLARLVVDGVLTVAVKGSNVTVAMRNATHRASALPSVWVPVVVAALTERELPAVRAAMRRGVNLFAPLSVSERAP
jgi:hypothetical protein